MQYIYISWTNNTLWLCSTVPAAITTTTVADGSTVSADVVLHHDLVGVLLAIGAVVSLLELVHTILSNPEELSRLCLVQQFAILIICRRFDKKMGQAKVSWLRVQRNVKPTHTCTLLACVYASLILRPWQVGSPKWKAWKSLRAWELNLRHFKLSDPSEGYQIVYWNF